MPFASKKCHLGWGWRYTFSQIGMVHRVTGYYSVYTSVANIVTVMHIPLLIMNTKNQCNTSMLMGLVDTPSTSGFQLPEDMTKLFGNTATPKSVSCWSVYIIKK